MKLVIDTNVLMAIVSRRSQYYWLFQALINGEYTLCVTTEILEEYEEIMSREWSALAAERTMLLLENLPNLEQVTVYYNWQLITVDPDDNKFIDCAIACNAHYIISQDKHFDELLEVDFPKVNRLKLDQLQELLRY